MLWLRRQPEQYISLTMQQPSLCNISNIEKYYIKLKEKHKFVMCRSRNLKAKSLFLLEYFKSISETLVITLEHVKNMASPSLQLQDRWRNAFSKYNSVVLSLCRSFQLPYASICIHFMCRARLTFDN